MRGSELVGQSCSSGDLGQTSENTRERIFGSLGLSTVIFFFFPKTGLTSWVCLHEPIRNIREWKRGSGM